MSSDVKLERSSDRQSVPTGDISNEQFSLGLAKRASPRIDAGNVENFKNSMYGDQP